MLCILDLLTVSLLKEWKICVYCFDNECLFSLFNPVQAVKSARDGSGTKDGDDLNLATLRSEGEGAEAERLLEEEMSAAAEADLSQMRETVFAQCGMIRDLEDDKKNLLDAIEELKTEKKDIDESVRELEEVLETKSNQIANLKESLNLSNEKFTKLLREDLEKNYRIIELEGKIEDLLRVKAGQELEIENLKMASNYENNKEKEVIVQEKVVESNNVVKNSEPRLEEDPRSRIDGLSGLFDEQGSNEINLENNVATKKDRRVSPSKEAFEFFKMKTLATLSKSGKKRRKCSESTSTPGKEVSMEETTFSTDSNTSTWRGDSGTLRSFLRSSIRR